MSRLYRALNRATDGNAPILPPEAGDAHDGEAEAGQSAFTVPWMLDGQAQPEAAEGAPADQALFSPEPARPLIESSSEARERLVGSPEAAKLRSYGLAVEQYRKLAATLHHAQGNRGLKLIVVTSALPGEGKSLTASNLALTLSESYQRSVLLIDGDLRRPSLHEIFGIPNGAGLSDGFRDDAIRKVDVVEISPRLFVLLSGKPVEDPTGLLTSRRMKSVLDTARSQYDWVIVDTPPIGLLSDAKLLSHMVDGVVLVVEAATTPYPDVLRTIDTIGRDRLLGVVLNRFHEAFGEKDYYSRYYRRAHAPKP
jgi:capsular exopolysaccharide synthesis family protein